MRLYLLDADYFDEENRSLVRLFCKDVKGNTIVAIDYDFYPYFYIFPKKGKLNQMKIELENIKSVKIKCVEIVEKMLENKTKLLKVSCYQNKDISKIRDIIKAQRDIYEKSFEYSFNFYKKYIKDKQIEGWIEIEGSEISGNYLARKTIRIEKLTAVKSSDVPKLKLLAFDLETIETEGMQRPILISLKTENFERVLTYRKGKYKKIVEVVKDEENLLKRFVQIIKEVDPDIIFGYNSDDFDFQILRNCANSYPKLKLVLSRDGSRMVFSRRSRFPSAKINGRVHLDLFRFVKTILSSQMQTEVLTLDSVSTELLNDKKLDMDYTDIRDSLKKNRNLQKLANYCLKDSKLTLKLGKFLLPQIYQLSKISGQMLFDSSRMTYSQLVEGYLTKKATNLNMVIPNQPKWQEIQARRSYSSYTGGFVKEPISGLHENIAVMDFRSLYPSLIASFNISPETFKCKCCKKKSNMIPERDYWFCKNTNGFISSSIKELILKRELIKKSMTSKLGSSHTSLNNEQFAIKTVANATYGYLGFPGSRWYCKECADATAALGRFYIKKVIEMGEREGFVTIYADTDSMFVKTKGNLKKKVEDFLTKTNKVLPDMVKLELQGIYKRGLFIPKDVGKGSAKKRYALIDKTGTLTIRGLEKVRKDWSNVAKNTQEEVLRLVLKDKDVENSVKHVKSVIKKLREGKILLKDLVIIEQITKPLSEYRIKSPHVSAARKLEENGRTIKEGTPILFVITKGRGLVSERSEPYEYANLDDIDIEYYIAKQIVPAALRVLKVMGVTEEDLLGRSLKSFIKK